MRSHEDVEVKGDHRGEDIGLEPAALHFLGAAGDAGDGESDQRENVSRQDLVRGKDESGDE